MRLSKKTEYALAALIALARDPEPASHSIQEICARENAPVKFLEQILLALRRGGLVTSRRGAGGGYTLRKPASQIRVSDVVDLIEGPPEEAANTRPEGASGQAVRGLVRELGEASREILRSRTIEDLVRAARDPGAGSFEI